MSAFPIKEILDIPVPEITIVDIGAMLDEEERYQPLLEQGLAQVVGFEPQAEQYEKLIKAQHGPCRYLPYFLGKGGAATFYVTHFPGCSSNYEPDPSVIDIFSTIGTGPGANFRVTETMQVETHRLDDIEECPAPDYIKLDTQGSELDILESGTTKLASALVIETEVEFVPLYKNQPLFGDLQTFLRRHGFVLHKFIDIRGRTFNPVQHPANPFVPISQLHSADAIFVRDFAFTERFDEADIIKTVVILHDIYKSYDLVAYFLHAWDLRTGADRMSRYMQRMAEAGQGEILFLNIRDRP